MGTLANSFVNVLNIVVILFIVFFVFAVIAVQLFGQIRFGVAINTHNNFQTFPMALFALSRVALGDFVQMNRDCSVQPPDCTQGQDCGVNPALAAAFYTLFINIASYVFLNLFVAVVMENFTFMYSISHSKLQSDLRISEKAPCFLHPAPYILYSVPCTTLTPLTLHTTRAHVHAMSRLFIPGRTLGIS